MKKMCLPSALAILLVLLLTACGGQKQSENVISESSDSANSIAEYHALTLEELANRFAEACEAGYGHAEATVSDDLITVNTWKEQLSSVLFAISPEDWESMKEGFLRTANACREVLDADGYADVHLAMNFVDDENLDRPFLSSYDSEIVYDILSE